MHYFFYACFFSLLAIAYAAGNEKSGCLEREKAIALLKIAEGLLSKAGKAFPSCKVEFNSINGTDCKGEKTLAYIEISKKLISDVRENFPTCIKSVEKDDKNVTKPIEEDEKIVQEDKPKDCSEILASGRNKSGVYTIWPSENNTTGNPLKVYCDMETDHGGWTVIQRRGKYPVQQSFYQNWESYKNGFGNIKEEFWLGNENIRVLCHKVCEIRIDLEDSKGTKGFALYRSFKLSNTNYTINITGYTGNVGDCLLDHNNLEFSTKDHGQTERARTFRGGWWYIKNDHCSNLNGILQPELHLDELENMFWYKWRQRYGLAAAEMKVRPKKI